MRLTCKSTIIFFQIPSHVEALLVNVTRAQSPLSGEKGETLWLNLFCSTCQLASKHMPKSSCSFADLTHCWYHCWCQWGQNLLGFRLQVPALGRLGSGLSRLGSGTSQVRPGLEQWWADSWVWFKQLTLQPQPPPNRTNAHPQATPSHCPTPEPLQMRGIV